MAILAPPAHAIPPGMGRRLPKRCHSVPVTAHDPALIMRGSVLRIFAACAGQAQVDHLPTVSCWARPAGGAAGGGGNASSPGRRRVGVYL